MPPHVSIVVSSGIPPIMAKPGHLREQQIHGQELLCLHLVNINWLLQRFHPYSIIIASMLAIW